MSHFETPLFLTSCVRLKCINQVNFSESIAIGECFRLILVTSGSGILQINETRVVCSAPAILCLSELETINALTPGMVTASEFLFHPDWVNPNFTFENLRSDTSSVETSNDVQDKYFLKPFLTRNQSYQGLFNYSPEVFLGLRQIFNAAYSQLTERPDNYWPCRSRSYLIQALITISDYFSFQSLRPTPSPNEVSLPSVEVSQIIGEIIAFLHHHFTDEIQITDLERRFALNRTTLAEKFKQATGQTIMSYLRNLRLRIAASLLQETRVPISEIGERVGYGDPSHFGRTFKEEYFLSPKEYRDQFCWVGRKKSDSA